VTTGQWVLLVTLVLIVAFALYRLASDGRFVGTRQLRESSVNPVEQPFPRLFTSSVSSPRVSSPRVSSLGVLADSEFALMLGSRATLVQFSTAFCAPCRVTRRILAEVAEAVPGVTHVEIDAEQHLGLVRALGILRTPTTVILNAQGHEVTRASGAPKKEQVTKALANAM
jgi:thiol-disulfide isomerase/thioredoxin